MARSLSAQQATEQVDHVGAPGRLGSAGDLTGWNMVKALTVVFVNACALAVAAWIFTGIRIGGPAMDTSDQLIHLAIVAAVFGLINTFLAPVIKLLSLPFIVLTLGVALIIINALMLLLVSRFAAEFDLQVSVDGFATAFWASIVISLVSAALNLILDD
jgi:putative membrane protein